LKRQLRMTLIVAIMNVSAIPAWTEQPNTLGKATAVVTGAKSGVAAVSANSLLNSFGVNVHVAQGYRESNYVDPLKYTGIRNIRDSGEKLAEILELHQNTGVKIDLLMWCDLKSELTSAQQLATTGALLSIEGPNEPNNFLITYNGQKGGKKGDWLPVAQCQQAIYSAVKNSSVLGSYPVFHTSEGGAEPINLGLQFLKIPVGAGTSLPDGTQFADYANVHNYVSSTSRTLYEDNQAWKAADPTLNSWWDGLYAEYGHTWRAKFDGYTDMQLQKLPRVTTETGWDSSTNPGGEAVQGKVLVNTYLSQFKRGWSYTFIYELADGEGGPGHQGIYTSDFSPKLAAAYIHNLTTILADQGEVSSPGSLNYAIPNEPETVHDLLLQKTTGPFDLVVWGEQSTGSSHLTIDFGVSHETVSVYDVTAGTAPISIYRDVSSVPLTVSDHAVILEINN
jgi:hypothetical protein